MWSTGIAAVAVALAVLVLLPGWLADIRLLIRLHPSYAAMVPSTALCFILIGGGIVIRQQKAADAGSLLPLAASAIVAAIAVFDLLVRSTGWAPGIDSLFWREAMGRDAMAFATAASFLLAAYCLAALSLPDRIGDGAYAVCATIGMLASLVAIVGYAFDSEALYSVFVFTAMALHTAIAFALLFAAFLLARHWDSWPAILLGPGSGSKGARRLFPFVILGPFLLCLIVLWATEEGAWNANFRLSLLAIAMMLIAGTAVLRNAAIENRSERQLLDTMGKLEAANADKEILLREVYHRVKNNLQQISAMMRMESRRMGDDRLKQSFDSMTERVQALGLVHQLLIASPAPSQVSVPQFLDSLCRNIAAGHDLDHRDIAVEVDADEETVHLDVAVSIGLLVNELVVNAIEHAFEPGGNGLIRVSYQRHGAEIHLVVADDGVGLEDETGEKEGGTGFVIVRSTVAQLEASMDVESGDGTRVVVRIPADINERNRYE